MLRFGCQVSDLGPAQWACNLSSTVVNVCNDGQHIDFQNFTIPSPPSVNCSSPVTTDGLAGDACVNSCRYQGGCTDGFDCVGVGSVSNNRIGLCLPTGGTLTGQSCNSNTQCEFGYCANGKCSRDCTRDGICTAGTSCVNQPAPVIEGMTYRRCE